MPNNSCAAVRRLSRLRANVASLHGGGNREQESHPLRKSFDSAIMRTAPRRGATQGIRNRKPGRKGRMSWNST